MNKQDIDIVKEFKSKDYEKVIDYVDLTQQELIKLWKTENSNSLEHMILTTRNVLNFWMDSVCQDRLCATLIRCGALIGTLETIEKLIYEKNMDLWQKNRIPKAITSNRIFSKIIQILDSNGVMIHNEMIEKMQSYDNPDIVAAINIMSNLQLINIIKLGKSNLYSLTDAGIRYARNLKVSN